MTEYCEACGTEKYPDEQFHTVQDLNGNTLRLCSECEPEFETYVKIHSDKIERIYQEHFSR